MKKLLTVACATALIGGCGSFEPMSSQDSTSRSASGSTYAGSGPSRSTVAATSAASPAGSVSKTMDFNRMDSNGDGWVSREEYLSFYGTRYDTMKRNERGMVSWQDMQTSDGRFFDPGTTSNTTGNPVTPRVGTSGGIGNPPATGGGSK